MSVMRTLRTKDAPQPEPEAGAGGAVATAVIGPEAVEAAVEKALDKFLSARDGAGLGRALMVNGTVPLPQYLQPGGEEVKAVDHLLHVRVDERRDGDWRGEMVTDLQKAADQFYLVNTLINGQRLANKLPPHPVDEMKSWQQFRRVAEQAAKAFNITDNANWIPEYWSSQLIDLVELERRLPSLLTPITLVNMNMTWPVAGLVGSLPYILDVGGDTGTLVPTTNLTTNKVTFDADAIGLRMVVTEKADEASIVVAQTVIMQELARAIVYGEEQIILNGDTTAVHRDAAVTAANDCRRLRMGLRYSAIDGSMAYDVQAGTGTWNVTAAVKTRGMMDAAYRTRLEDLLWVFSPAASDVITGDTTNWGNFQVAYAISEALATNITGGYNPTFLGSQKVLSAAMPETMDATGVNPGNGTQTAVLVVARSAWGFARAGGLRGDVIWDAETRQYRLVVAEYIDLKPFRAADKTLGYGYNINPLA